MDAVFVVQVICNALVLAIALYIISLCLIVIFLYYNAHCMT